MGNFQLYSKYYDLLYKDKNYTDESDYVKKTLIEYAPNTKSIIELGCGSGSHAYFLCQSGFQVTGLERSAEMVEAALEKNILGFDPIQSDITDFHLNRKFDAAISLFHVINYLTGNRSLIECFSLTNEHLNDGGIFLFDMWYSPAVYIQKPETRIKRMEDDDVQITRIAESLMHTEINVVEVNFEVIIKNKETGGIVTLNEKHPMRHFSLPEIELLAQQTGFELVKAEEFLTGNAPSSKTWGVCCVLKKTKNI